MICAPPHLVFFCLESFALFAAQRLDYFGDIEGVLPIRPGRVFFGVDEELVVLLGIVLSDPAVGEWSLKVFHRPASLGWDAILRRGDF